MVFACSVVMLRGANSHWVSLRWLCKPTDGIAELTVGCGGREEVIRELFLQRYCPLHPSNLKSQVDLHTHWN